MIDLHSHILPGIDDGARSISMSLMMAQQAVDVGISHMVCTPHMHQGHYDNSIHTIQHSFDYLTERVAALGLDLSLSFAAEVRADESLPDWIRNRSVPFLGELDGRPVLLLELPHSHVPVGIENLLRWLKAHGIQPLIAHPERNREIQRCPELIRRLRGLGCMLQVTAGALVRRFGDNPFELGLAMLHGNKIDVVASDTHDIRRRPNDMLAAYELICAEMGEPLARRLCVETPHAIVSGVPDYLESTAV